MKKLFLLFILLISILIVFVIYSLFLMPCLDKEISIKVQKGSSISNIYKELNNFGYLKPLPLFQILHKLFVPVNKTIVSGTHKIPKNISNFQLLKGLFTGDFVHRKKITFPEGKTIYDYASILKKELSIDSTHFINLATSPEITRKWGIPTSSVEGYLYPATYLLDYEASASEILETLIEQFNFIWNNNFNEIQFPLNMDKHQIITLASIVEAESPVIDERPTIAGVYINRIKIGMPLQADPTVQYGLKKFTRLTYADLKINHPYNTYKNTGLPPTPINSPSLNSIKAVLNYEKHNYLYFVARGDSTKMHNFAETYDEHLKNVALYRKNVKGKTNG